MLEFDVNDRIKIMKVILLFDVIRSGLGFLNLVLTAAVFKGFDFFEQAQDINMYFQAGVILIYSQIIFWGAIMPIIAIFQYREIRVLQRIQIYQNEIEREAQ